MFYKRSLVINSIYSGQQLFSYATYLRGFRLHKCLVAKVSDDTNSTKHNMFLLAWKDWEYLNTLFLYFLCQSVELTELKINLIMKSHRHLSNIDCLTAHTPCLVCFFSTANGCNKKEKKRSL